MSAPTRTATRLVQALIVLALSVSYFSYVFRLPDGTFLTSGLADWVDPYFINFLLEHWRHAVWTLTDPSSPPMYFPVRGTLGYSHGLILYAPFYIAVRLFLDPFPAHNVTLFLVLETGALCLYRIFRTFVRLGFIESLLLSAFFFSSANVINSTTGVWSQRASVFLIPPILLMALVSARMPKGRSRLSLAWLSGLLSSLLFTQDFYTAAMAVLVSALFLAGALTSGWFICRKSDLAGRITAWWKRDTPYILAFTLGGFIGCLVFVWIYFGVYRAHPAFPEDQLLNSLTTIDLSRPDWRRLGAYDSLRSFTLVFVVAILAWMPWFRLEKNIRLYCLWFLFVSFIVLVIPLRFNQFSIWKIVFAPLPGLSVIRDPKRIIQLYELAVALLAALFLTQLPRKSPFRVSIVLLVFLLLVTEWNRNVLDFARPTSVYARWVEAPIDIDSSCKSFFIKGASDAYMSRSSNKWSLYAVDSMFISLNVSIPTLNGYSAWWPDEWRLSNPQEPGYSEAVGQWIARQNLRDVCELDIEARTMRPYVP